MRYVNQNVVDTVHACLACAPGITLEDLTGKDRIRDTVSVRRAVVFLSYRCLANGRPSYPEIAAVLRPGKSHSGLIQMDREFIHDVLARQVAAAAAERMGVLARYLAALQQARAGEPAAA